MPQYHETDRVKSDYPTFFFHVVEPATDTMRHMGDLRAQYIQLATDILALCPPNRSRSLALTDLEASLMRAIQSLALTGKLVDPRIRQETPCAPRLP
jgi:hypothetical protein